jgi:hypothetical protein
MILTKSPHRVFLEKYTDIYRSALSKCAAIWNKSHRSSGAADAIEDIAQMRYLQLLGGA